MSGIYNKLLFFGCNVSTYPMDHFQTYASFVSMIFFFLIKKMTHFPMFDYDLENEPDNIFSCLALARTANHYYFL